MKNLRLLFFALACSTLALSQGVRYDIPPIITAAGKPISAPVISLCPGTATVSGASCSPATAQSTTDITTNTLCPIGSPVTLTGLNTCQATGDVLGNAGFWLKPGAYIYCVTAASFAGSCYNLTVPLGTTSAGAIPSATITGALTASQVNGRFYVDGVKYTTLNAAFTACNVSPGCRLELPPGNFNFSTQLAPTNPLYLAGSGAMLSNAGSNCITTLTWTGAAVVPISISGTAVSGSMLKDFCLNINTGTPPPVAIDIDNSANGTRLDHIILDIPTTPATVAGVRWGNTVGVSDAGCVDTYVRGEPIGFDIIGVRSGWKGVRCRGVLNTVHDFVIGSATSASSDISCFGCYAENGPGVIPIQILNVINFDLFDVYQECGAAASSWCIDIPNTATAAFGVKIYGGFFSGQNPATAPAAAIHVNLATADVHVFGVHLDNHWPNPTSIVRNDSAALVSVVGSNINVTGGVVVSTTAANVTAAGNTAAGVALADYYFRTSGDTTDYAGNSSGGSAGVTFTNTGASGHKWLWGEIVAGHNGFRDLTQANNPWWSMSASGGGFEGLLNHANTANRAYNFPDATGPVPITPNLAVSATAPTIAAAGCGGAAASIVVSNGTAAFKVNVGTTPTSACTLTFPAATTGWNVNCNDITTQSTSVFVQKQTGAESTTSVTITNFNDVAVATAFTASDILKCTAVAD